MPKERKGHSLSSHNSRSSPYPCSSNRSACTPSRKSSESAEDVKEWEEARCPVCMEHPHNAVLLQCSSHHKGCRPFMCNTSSRHSNCLDQFCKTFTENPTDTTEEATPTNLANTSELPTSSRQNLSCGNQKNLKLVCPLCRGEINGWTVVEAARNFMNAKARSCACETCDYSGTYANLRKHARLEHPFVRPSEADPERQRDWTRLERERDLGDVLSTIQSALGDERGATEENLFVSSSLLSVFIFFHVPQAPFYSLSETQERESLNIFGPSRSSGRSRTRSRTSRRQLWGESVDMEAGSNGTEDEENGSRSSERFLGTRRRNRRWRTPDDDFEL